MTTGMWVKQTMVPEHLYDDDRFDADAHAHAMFLRSIPEGATLITEPSIVWHHGPSDVDIAVYEAAAQEPPRPYWVATVSAEIEGVPAGDSKRRDRRSARMTRLHHWYHVYADGEWQLPLYEHLVALRTSGLAAALDTPVHVGIVGSDWQRKDVEGQLRREWLVHMPQWRLPPVTVVEQRTGWEHVTLFHLHDSLHEVEDRAGLVRLADDDLVLYAHTKGGSVPSLWNATWRRGMTEGVVTRWKQCVDALTVDGYESAGCHWLTPEAYPDAVHSPFYGGNFWWATTAFLRTLPRPSLESRHEAESWIGRGDRPPRALDLAPPGWPSESTVLRPIDPSMRAAE